MRSACVGVLLCSLYVVVLSSSGQVPQATVQPVVQRDLQAVALVQQAIKAMGSTVPSDSVAAGTVTVLAGTSADQGTIRILTRGTNQTSEQIQTPRMQVTEVFSTGLASQSIGNTNTSYSANRAVTSQAKDFPLPLLAGLLANPDEALQFIGLEQVGSASAEHLRATNTYSSQHGLQVLSDFTATDIWFDAQTALPLRIAWIQRDGAGASPRINRETWYSGYQNFSGVLYPTSVEEFYNGSLWKTIKLQTVSLNTGLADTNFPVAEVQP